MMQSYEYSEYEKAFKSQLQKDEEKRFMDTWEIDDEEGTCSSIDHPWWRAKDYEETETGEK